MYPPPCTQLIYRQHSIIMTSPFNNVIVSPFDGRPDECDDDYKSVSPAHAAFAKEIHDEQLAHFQSLPLEQQNVVLGVAGLDATQRAKKIILNRRIEDTSLLLTEDDIKLAVEDVLENIRDGTLNDTYFNSVIDVIIDRAVEDAPTRGHGVQGAAEQLLSIAARMVKGEKCECEECGPAVSHRPTNVHDWVVMGLKELEEVTQKLDLDWQLNERGRFSLLKLSTVNEREYREVKHLADTSERQDYRELRQMWSLENEDCDCWDEVGGAKHAMWCEMYHR